MPKQKLDKSKFDIIRVDRWDCPDDNGAAILTMPNVPKPLHTMAPRTLLGNRVWTLMRNTCYKKSDDTCEACGYKPENKRLRHAHELYSIDYANHTATFKRCVCLCYTDHVLGIHTGRALTMYKYGNPLYSAEKLLEGAEHVFTIISSYNAEHPDREPLRLYATWLDYMKYEELKAPMEKLIKKYDIKFYDVAAKWENPNHWGRWKLVIGDKEYPTKFANQSEWEQAMAENNAKQYGPAGRGGNTFKGEVYDELDKIFPKKPIDIS